MGPGGEGEVKTGITQAAPEDIAKPSASDAVPPTPLGRDQGVSKHDDDNTMTKNVEGVQGATESQSNVGDGAGQAGSERASTSSHKPAYSGSLVTCLMSTRAHRHAYFRALECCLHLRPRDCMRVLSVRPLIVLIRRIHGRCATTWALSVPQAVEVEQVPNQARAIRTHLPGN